MNRVRGIILDNLWDFMFVLLIGFARRKGVKLNEITEKAKSVWSKLDDILDEPSYIKLMDEMTNKKRETN